MNFPPVMIISMISLLLLLFPLLGVESSSLNHTTSSISNTTKGNSTLSTSLNNHTSFLSVNDTSSAKTKGSSVSPSLNDASSVTNNIKGGSSISTISNLTCWLSPSGNIAFGFYRLRCPDSSANCPDHYGVGIYFAKSPTTTLVWSSNRCYDKKSLVLIIDEGKLMLRSPPDNEEEPLIPTIQEPSSYGRMLDNGNFVLYGAGSEIVWQSFDHPTDTILSGQSLRSGVDLISSGSRLSIQEINGAVAIHTETSETVISDALEGSLRTPVILGLNTVGELYLVGTDGVVLKYLYENKNQEEESTVEEGIHMYRAKLDPKGHFSLYKERIDGSVGDHEEHSVLSKKKQKIKKQPALKSEEN